MFDKQILLLSLLLISTSISSLYANDNNNNFYQEKKLEAETQTDASMPANSSSRTQSLNLTVDPDSIEEQQETASKNQGQIFPDLFKDKNKGDVSMEGGVLIKNGSNNYEALDGAEISIKVKTD